MKPHEISRMAKGIIGKGDEKPGSDMEPDGDVEADEKDAGDFEGMSIDKADNGFSIRTRLKQPKLKHGEAQPYNEGTQHVFSADHPIARHILAILHHTKK